ncbi:lysine-specific demethylase 7A isoform X4 [Pezoporus occidentalis]|uniref:lysine-specific demethylase 7A isoform X4 n=1 Tax=Pezoporus occidentalis TaxID=407982 RepID=UPI002F91063D
MAGAAAAAATPVYCVCREPYDVSRFMIECDICKDWFHGSCVGVEEHHAVDIDLYHCPNCAILHGPSLMKKRRNWHRHDYTELDDGSKPVQAGTRTFVKQLRARSFPSADEVILKMHGSQLTQRYLEKHGFDVPIMVPKLDGLGLRLPPPTFSVLDVERYVGWIHAVLTSQDCMAFGGNFLHNLNIGMQLRCYEMEKRLKTPDLFKFPFFEAICWFVAKNLLETLKELREDGFQPPSYLVQGVKALLTALKLWMKKELVTEHAFEIPDNIRPGHLIKELSKVIRSVEEENSKLVKTQGILGVCPTSRSSHETTYPHHSRRRVRKLRDHATKTPSNLDILELHTREVLKRLEMSPWEEASINDTTSSKLNGRFNKPLQPSSTIPEWRTKDNDLRLLLSNGRIIRDERCPFTDRSLYTADSEDEDDRTRSKKTTVKVEEQPSGFEGEGNADAQKPLNMFFESVKSELRNGSSEYSDISDSEESEPDCTTQQKDSSTEESESSGDEEKQEVTSNFKEESKVTRDLCQNTQKPSRNETPSKKECPTSTSTEEEAIQGMLSMAGLHYTTCLPGHTQSTHCTDKRTSLQEHRSYPRSRHKERQPSQSHKTIECGRSVKEEEGDLGTSAWARHLNETSRITPQDTNKTQKYFKKEGASEANHKVQENRSIVHSNSLSFQHGKYTRDSSLIQECRLSDDSLSPDRLYGETSLSVPLHPTKRPASNPPPISNQATKGKRPKKGMATAKQRLGKILKLNRNGHARFFV